MGFEIKDPNFVEVLWYELLPWIFSKFLGLGWTFVASLTSYSPFLLMTLIENKLEDLKWKRIQQMQLRAREDYAIEELSAYKDGDDVDQYLKPGQVPEVAEGTEDEEAVKKRQKRKKTSRT